MLSFTQGTLSSLLLLQMQPKHMHITSKYAHHCGQSSFLAAKRCWVLKARPQHEHAESYRGIPSNQKFSLTDKEVIMNAALT